MHSPTPWEAERKHERDGDWWEIQFERFGKTRSVGDTLNRDCTIDPEEDADNARLFAAAPDLLAAIKRLLLEADDDGITREGVEQAQDAIVKAEGKLTGRLRK